MLAVNSGKYKPTRISLLAWFAPNWTEPVFVVGIDLRQRRSFLDGLSDKMHRFVGLGYLLHEFYVQPLKCAGEEFPIRFLPLDSSRINGRDHSTARG